MSSPWIEYLKSVDAPTLSNAIELLNLRPRAEGFAPLEIRCLFPEFDRMCGYAVTAQVETVTRSEQPDMRKFVELYRLVDSSPKPAVVVLQEIGGFPDYAAHCGEVMASIFTRLGAIGLVSDCAVRDIPEVRRLRFHYFARGAVASHANFRIARVGVPVQIHGLVVRTGDILCGDQNGLLLVPPGLEGSLPQAVEQIRSREGELLEFVRGETFTLDGLENRMVE